MAAIGMIYETTFSTCIRGYYLYQEERTPMLYEMFPCYREFASVHDPFATKVMKAGSPVIYQRKLVLLVHCSLLKAE